jgi:hypothetical protein
MTNQLLLPNLTWQALLDALLEMRTSGGAIITGNDLLFLVQLGFVNGDGMLSVTGRELCNLMHVRRDIVAADAITHGALASAPATQALLQSLEGLKDITVEQAKMALVFAGLTEQEVEARVTNFLMILNANGVLTYSRKNRSIRLLVSPKQSAAPSHIYIDRTRPYANDLWIREVLRECQGSIRWLDKYFQKEAFEWIWREANANSISSVEIISTVDDNGAAPLAIADYKRLKKELAPKGISVEWRVLQRNKAHDFHDRWIIDDQDLCYNVSSINSIKSGQRSELHRSTNHAEVRASFVEYWSKAQAI